MSAIGMQDSTLGPGISIVEFVTSLKARVPLAFEQSYLKSTPLSHTSQLHSMRSNSPETKPDTEATAHAVYALGDGKPPTPEKRKLN